MISCAEVSLHPFTHSLTHSGSGFGRRSIAPGFKPRKGYVRRVFLPSYRLITFGGQSAHFAYIVHKSGRKTAIFIFLFTQLINFGRFHGLTSTAVGHRPQEGRLCPKGCFIIHFALLPMFLVPFQLSYRLKQQHFTFNFNSLNLLI